MSNRKKYLGPNRPRRWEAILRRLPNDRPLIGAEIGVYAGATSEQLLGDRPLLTLMMVDPWAPFHEIDALNRPTRLSKLMETEGHVTKLYRDVCELVRPFGERAVIMRMTSEDAADRVADGSLDFVFIDALHTYEGVRSDITLWSPKVKAGGWIGGHDYRNLPRFPGVERAVWEAFADDFDTDGDCTWFHTV